MMFPEALRKAGTLLAAVLLLAGLVLSLLLARPTAYAASAVTINGATSYQTMDGFGFSNAFGPAQTLEGLSSSSEQKQILDLLFSPTSGAGFTILRNLFPSDASNTIEPTSPGSPTATPSYVALGSSEGQVWLAQQAKNYGVTQFYGDAWSAPGFMKTNGSEANGGQLCGSPGATTCSTGDWRQAYANYLLQYYKDYLSAGITLTHIGAFNEPNLTTSYSSMVMNPTQTADFVAILGSTLQAAGVSPQIVCCDGEGWDTAQSYASGITSNAGANAVTSVISSHGYTGAPTSALTGTGSKHIWQSEWSTFDTWDPNWDDGGDASGFTWAQHVYSGVTAANLSAFLYWWGVSFNGTDNGFLINDTNGSVVASKRLWALANYSRFVHPGATRIGATSGDSNLEVTAYKNTDGTLAVVVLNQSYNAVPATFALQNVTLPTSAVATPYVTDASNSTAAQAALALQNGSFSATIGARQLVTYRIATGTSPTPTPTVGTTPTVGSTPTVGTTPTATPTQNPGTACRVHYAITGQWSGGFQAALTITNTGTTAINGWSLQFSFANGQAITLIWNGSAAQSGNAVTITNLSYNAAIPPGASLGSAPGFLGSWNGSNAAPTAFKLNGTNCAVV
ncbi:MAG TPA: cellulose binding domain-containing protein [Ktedonobacteraceae bacterium]|nr:cellulose binding domain-containing protein [Ktedonobacteraceae bacterium]